MRYLKHIVIGIYFAASFVLLILVIVYFSSVKQLKENVNRQIASLNNYATVSYDDLSVNIFTGTASLRNIKVNLKNIPGEITSEANLRFETAQFSSWRRVGQNMVPYRVELAKPSVWVKSSGKMVTFPLDRVYCNISEEQGFIKIFFNIEGLVINPKDILPEIYRDLKTMGYDYIKISLEENEIYNSITKQNTSEIRLIFEKMGALHCKTKMGNINATDLISCFVQNDGSFDINKIILEAEKLSQNMTFHSIELGYQDMSLSNKLINLLAKKQRTSSERFRNDMISGIEMLVHLFPFLQPFQGNIQSVKQFIRNPDEIRLTVASKKPIPIGKLERMNSLREADEILSGLEIKITSGAKEQPTSKESSSTEKENELRLKGKWKMDRIIMADGRSKPATGEVEFFKDKTVLFPGGKGGSWTILEDGRIKINLMGFFMFGSFQNNTLKLTSPNAPGESPVLIKMK